MLAITPDGSVYGGIARTGISGAEHGRLPVIYHISPEGTLLDCFAAGDREWNIVDSMATDAQGRLYTRMRMQEDGGYVRIYTAEGDSSERWRMMVCMLCKVPEPGTGKGRKSLCSSTGNGECDSRG